jgi:ubiquinone/menaquinone biosynthesis C-methylase UbiE
MLQRVLEPEVMDDPREAQLYDEMDHQAVNKKFVEDMLSCGSVVGRILDVGTGTAQIPIEICRQAEQCQVMACDLAVSMLDIARRNIAIAGFEHRIRLYHGDAKSLDCEEQTFDWVVSNSLIHHIPEPGPVIQQMLRVLRPGGRLFLRDLLRPDTNATIESLVQLYTGDQPEMSQQLFRQSLAAALSLDEVRQLAKQFGFSPESVQATSDRHWTWSGKREN